VATWLRSIRRLRERSAWLDYGMCKVAARVVAIAVLVVLLPVVCVQGEADPGPCDSLVLSLPWAAENGDTWGVLVAVIAAGLAFLLVLKFPWRR